MDRRILFLFGGTKWIRKESYLVFLTNQKDYEHIYKCEVRNGDLEFRICNWLNGSLWIVVREAYLDAGCSMLVRW